MVTPYACAPTIKVLPLACVIAMCWSTTRPNRGRRCTLTSRPSAGAAGTAGPRCGQPCGSAAIGGAARLRSRRRAGRGSRRAGRRDAQRGHGHERAAGPATGLLPAAGCDLSHPLGANAMSTSIGDTPCTEQRRPEPSAEIVHDWGRVHYGAQEAQWHLISAREPAPIRAT